jgi:ribosomal protein L37AE/L43A
MRSPDGRFKAKPDLPRCAVCGILAVNRAGIEIRRGVCDRCRREAARGAKMTGDAWWELR